MSPVLYPPLAKIRADLFGEETESNTDASSDPGVESPLLDDDSSVPPIPDYLKDLIRRKVAAAEANTDAPLSVGQIRAIVAVPATDSLTPTRALGRTCGVLLEAHDSGRLWRGWLVAQEADYASDRDLVIQENDGAIDPVAAMVLTWAPVSIMLTGSESLLGTLAPTRLAAVKALSELPQSTADNKARPGFIFSHELADGLLITTGSPLGDDQDPRHEYRILYQRLADEVSAAALVRQTGAARSQPEEPSLLGWLVATFVKPQWTFAAMAASVVLGVTLLVAKSETDETEIVRSQAQACAPKPQIRVTFKPSASHTEIIRLLRQNEARVVDGPSETGELWLSFPVGKQVDEILLQQLRISHIVDDIIIISHE